MNARFVAVLAAVKAPLALLSILALTAAAVLGPAPASAAQVQRARYLMGTICTVVADAADTLAAVRGLSRGLDEIAALERVMSSWRTDSEVSRLNATGSMWFPCSRDLYAVLDSSMAFAQLTGGAFDPTIEPLMRVWDMRGKGRVPKPFDAERALTLVGWHKLSLDPGTKRAFFAFTGMGVDLGGIGKGFALDRAAKRVRDAGVKRALFNFGGEVLAVGNAWEVTVADPNERLKPAMRLVVSDAAVSTSSQSEKGIVVKGKRYGHILDPRTGQPVTMEGSVTVVAPSGTRADALSTAFLVMGRDGTAAFAAKHPEVGVLWLENVEGSLQIWKWNLSKLAAETDTAVEWMN